MKLKDNEIILFNFFDLEEGEKQLRLDQFLQYLKDHASGNLQTYNFGNLIIKVILEKDKK